MGEWKPTTETPDVKPGNCREYAVAIPKRKGGHYVTSAWYLNAMEVEDITTMNCDTAEFTGWHQKGPTPEYEDYFTPCDPEPVAWCELPDYPTDPVRAAAPLLREACEAVLAMEHTSTRYTMGPELAKVRAALAAARREGGV